MKTSAQVIAMLERTIVNCRDAIAAIEADDIDLVVEKLRVIGERCEQVSAEMRRAA